MRSHYLIPILVVTACFIAEAPSSHVDFTPSNEISERILGGDTVEIEDHPYQVQVSSSIDGEETFLCSGSLLNLEFVLTTAGCVHGYKPEQLSVRAGSSTINHGGVQKNVSKVQVHTEFDAEKHINDIAVLKLTGSLEYSPKIKPINLALMTDLSPYEKATVTGWGRIDERGPHPEKLQKSNVVVWFSGVCLNTFLHNGVFCAHPEITIPNLFNPFQGPCKGDLGAPLVLRKGVRAKLYGIASYFFSCGGTAFYTDVRYFKNFIYGATKQEQANDEKQKPK